MSDENTHPENEKSGQSALGIVGTWARSSPNQNAGM